MGVCRSNRRRLSSLRQTLKTLLSRPFTELRVAGKGGPRAGLEGAWDDQAPLLLLPPLSATSPAILLLQRQGFCSPLVHRVSRARLQLSGPRPAAGSSGPLSKDLGQGGGRAVVHSTGGHGWRQNPQLQVSRSPGEGDHSRLHTVSLM